MKRWIFRILVFLLLSLIVSMITAYVILYPQWKDLEKETITLIKAHQSLETTHPGWSFPGTLYSASVSLQAEKSVVIAQAQAREYTLHCPATKPGEYCSDGTVIPRGGIFPEGPQPPGLDGWTRELALEPVFLGTIIGNDAEYREHVPIDEVPSHLIAALLYSEDAEFYNHPGVNFLAFGRAILANIQGGTYAQGASTITMQVVRNMTQQREKNIERKIREIAQSLILDNYLSKKEILQMYIDMPYLGQDGSFSICGFAAASRFYFQKDIREININEAAILVGILPGPGSLRPDKYPDKAQEKRDRVLRLLGEKKWNVTEALTMPIPIRSDRPINTFLYPSFTQAAISWLEDNLDKRTLYTTGMQVFTSLNIVLQQRTETILQSKLKFYMKELNLPNDPKNNNVLQAAAVLINPQSGYLEAVYGGTILSAYDFSRATQAKRQAGSSFKPLVYAMAFSQKKEDGSAKWQTFDTVPNDRRTFPNTNGWRPRNNGNKYSTTSTLTEGLTWSENIATASLLEKSGGPEALITFAKKMGFDTSKFPAEMGLALGQAEVTPLEMGKFVAMLANGGTQVHALPVTAAIDMHGHNHIIDAPLGATILDEETAVLTRELMRSVILHGTGGASRGSLGEIGFTGTAFGKTGTTDQNKDLWFIGSSPLYAGALWLGYDQPSNLKGSASDLAAPLWGWWMRDIHKGLSVPKSFSGITLKNSYLCAQTGKYGNASCKTLPMPMRSGAKASGVCPEKHPPPSTEEKKYHSVWQKNP